MPRGRGHLVLSAALVAAGVLGTTGGAVGARPATPAMPVAAAPTVADDAPGPTLAPRARVAPAVVSLDPGPPISDPELVDDIAVATGRHTEEVTPTVEVEVRTTDDAAVADTV